MKVRLCSGDFEVSLSIPGTPHPDLFDDLCTRANRMYKTACEDQVEVYGLTTVDEGDASTEMDETATVVEDQGE